MLKNIISYLNGDSCKTDTWGIYLSELICANNVLRNRTRLIETDISLLKT